MIPWSPVLVANVTAAGNVTQLFPSFVTPGTGATTMGTERRSCTEGVLYRIDISPSDAVGGYFELWDVCGVPYGVTNNIDTGTVLTNAFLILEQAANRGRMIWRVDFKGDSGMTTKTFSTRVPFNRGLAGRYVNIVDAVGSKNVTVNIVAEGGYRKSPISG